MSNIFIDYTKWEPPEIMRYSKTKAPPNLERFKYTIHSIRIINRARVYFDKTKDLKKTSEVFHMDMRTIKR